jgi:hypothetical protein
MRAADLRWWLGALRDLALATLLTALSLGAASALATALR